MAREKERERSETRCGGTGEPGAGLVFRCRLFLLATLRPPVNNKQNLQPMQLKGRRRRKNSPEIQKRRRNEYRVCGRRRRREGGGKERAHNYDPLIHLDLVSGEEKKRKRSHESRRKESF